MAQVVPITDLPAPVAVKSSFVRTSRPPRSLRDWVEAHRPQPHWSLELVVAIIATAVSFLAFAYWSRRGLILAYTDAISHMEIARHVWFASTPGLAQLGSSWLPLDHLLMLPFIWIEPLYRSGLAGALPSMAAYVIGCTAMANLGRTLYNSTWAGILAAAVYGANPNLIYLQATPMGESSMLAAAVLTALFLARWIKVAARGGRRFRWHWRARIGAEDLETTADGAVSGVRIVRGPTSPQVAKGTVLSGLPEVAPLVLLAVSACAATLLRYDGWALTMAAGLAVVSVAFFLWGPRAAQARLIVFGFLGFAGCVGWLLYNQIIFGDALDFFRGDYSSGHQQQHIAGEFGLPSKGNLLLSLHIYAQTVLDNAGILIVIVAAIGLLAAFVYLVARPLYRMLQEQPTTYGASKSGQGTSTSDWPMRAGLTWVVVIGVLSVPFLFNWAALYAGNTIILTPEVPAGNLWSYLGVDHAYFNGRYGLMMLPLLALGIGAFAPLASDARRRIDEAVAWSQSALSILGSAVHKALVGGTVAALLLVGCASTVAATPYVLADPLAGVGARGSAGAQSMGIWLKDHYHGGLILASTGAFAGVTFYTGLPDSDFINESTKPVFTYALVAPQDWATMVVLNADSSSYDPVYDYLMTRGNTSWEAYYTLVYQVGSTSVYQRNP